MTTRFTTEFVNELEASNYFGEGENAEIVKENWLGYLAIRGYKLGSEYDADEFDEISARALTLCVWLEDDTEEN
jgi:hypothetical protein